MKKETIKNSKNFYLQLIAITVVSGLFIMLMTGYVNKRITALSDAELSHNTDLLEFGAFINSYPAIERLADHYGSKKLDCESTSEALGIFLGYACKGYYGKKGLEKAKSYRREYLASREECYKESLSPVNLDFSCEEPGYGGEHDIVNESTPDIQIQTY